jgi:hypothetical protein
MSIEEQAMIDRSRRSRTVAATLLAAVAIGATSSAQAQTDDRRLRVALYGWFPGLGGTTQLPSGAGGPSIDINASDLLSGLKMAFMGTLEAQNGKWGVLADWVYTDVGSDKSGTRQFSIQGRPLPADLVANLSLDVKTNIVTLAGTYSFIEKPEYSMGMIFGARMLDMDQTLNWSFAGAGPLGIARSGTSDFNATNWDAVVGVRGRARFGDDLRWFVPYHADVGGGDSKLTWQALAGLGYSFGWGDVLVAWRYLDYDFKSDQRAQSLSFNGVAVGVSFKF